MLQTSAASDTSFDSGDDVTISVDAEDFDGTLVVTTSEGVLELVSCNVPGDQDDCSGSVTGSGTSSVSVDTNAADGNSSVDVLSLTLTLTGVDCENNDDDFTVTATQDSSDEEIELTCLAPDPETGSITIVKDTNPESSAITFYFDGDLGSFNLEDDESVTFSDLPAGTYIVTEDETSDWELTDISCSGSYSISGDSAYIELDENEDVTCTFVNEAEEQTGSVTIVKDTNPESSAITFYFDGDLGSFNLEDDESVTFSDLPAGTYIVTEGEASDWELTDISCSGSYSISGDSAYIELDENEDVTCTFVNEAEAAVAPSSVLVTVESSSLQCGESTYLTVTVTDADGYAVESVTVVTVSTSLGSVSPSLVQTSGGQATVLYTAPANTSGIATIGAHSGGASGSKSIVVSCEAAAPAPAATTVAPPSPVVVSPPSAGDGGLLESNSSGESLPSKWLLLAGGTVAAGMAVTGGAEALRRARGSRR